MINIYRRAGLITWLCILLILLGVTVILTLDVMKGPNLVKVSFPNVGTLILQEPVSMDGVQVGQVASIEYTRLRNPDVPETSEDSIIETALVTLEFFKRLKLPKDSKIINFNYSMMGARMIFIERGDSAEFMDLSKVQKGIFRSGVAEMLHKAEVLLDLVKKYQDYVNILAEGTDTSISVFDFYNDHLKPFFTKYTALIKEMQEIDTKVKEKVALANSYVTQLTSLKQTVERTVPRMVKETDRMLVTMMSHVEKADTLISKIQEQMDRINKEESLVRKLVYEKELYSNLRKLSTTLNAVVLFLKGEGIRIERVRFWGRNPSKKKNTQ